VAVAVVMTGGYWDDRVQSNSEKETSTIEAADVVVVVGRSGCEMLRVTIARKNQL